MTCNKDSDAMHFWLDVLELKSPMGQYMYSTLTLQLPIVSILVSTAHSERVFSI